MQLSSGNRRLDNHLNPSIIVVSKEKTLHFLLLPPQSRCSRPLLAPSTLNPSSSTPMKRRRFWAHPEPLRSRWSRPLLRLFALNPSSSTPTTKATSCIHTQEQSSRLLSRRASPICMKTTPCRIQPYLHTECLSDAPLACSKAVRCEMPLCLHKQHLLALCIRPRLHPPTARRCHSRYVY